MALPAPELALWMAFDRIEPFGAWAADARHSAALHHHAVLQNGENARRFKPTDFAIGSWKDGPILTDEEKAAQLEAWLAAREEGADA